jgi:hypothetical protein
MTDLAPAAAPELQIGERAPEFDNLLGIDGARYGMASFSDRRLLAIIFSSNRCPTVKAYEERLRRLHDDYGPAGVQMVAVNSNDPYLHPEESFERMVEFGRDSGYQFPYLFDEGQRVGRAFGARCTFHIFVLDHDRRLRYSGRFDDSRIPARVTSHDLRSALDDLLAGRAVRVPLTRPFGCSLDYV